MLRDNWTYIFESADGYNRLYRIEAYSLDGALLEFARSHGYSEWWGCSDMYRIKSMRFDGDCSTAIVRLIWLGENDE